MKHIILIIPLLCSCFGVNNLDKATMESNRTIVTNQVLNSKILFSRRVENNRGWSIFMINPDGSDEEVLIPLASGMGEYNPDISPDGSTILFNTYRYGGWKLASFDISNNQIKRITTQSDYFTNGVYSPDGKQIVYEKNKKSGTHIYLAGKNGLNEKILTSSKDYSENRVPSWASDGKSVIFYSDKEGINDIFQVTLDNLNITNLSNNPKGNDFAPSVSPDGKQVAFFSDRNGHLDLYLMDMDGKNQINLTNKLQNDNNEYNYYKDNNLFWIFKVSWSPNGEKLVFSNTKSNKIELFTINSNGSSIKQITNSKKSIYTPVWGSIRK